MFLRTLSRSSLFKTLYVLTNSENRYQNSVWLVSKRGWHILYKIKYFFFFWRRIERSLFKRYLRGINTHGWFIFRHIVYKGDNFCDFLFDLQTRPSLKMGLLLKECICFKEAQSVLVEQASISERCNHNAVLPESVYNLLLCEESVKLLVFYSKTHIGLGPVIKSVVSLTSSLEVKLLTALVSTISNSQVFFLKKIKKWVAFALLLTYFQQKY